MITYNPLTGVHYGTPAKGSIVWPGYWPLRFQIDLLSDDLPWRTVINMGKGGNVRLA